MNEGNSITTWISMYKAGERKAAQPLWENYFRRLIGLARKILQTNESGTNDVEDVALSAIKSAFHGMEQGKFPRLNDREDLWALLAAITRNKAVDVLKKAQKIPNCVGDSPIDQFMSEEPTPQMAAQFADECRHMLAKLEDENLPEKLRGKDIKRIAMLKLDGSTNQTIATKLNRPLRAVERGLAIIRTIWEQDEE